MTALRRAVPCDAWCIGTIDPATLMITGSIGDGYPMKGSGRFVEIEYNEPNIFTYAGIARSKPPTASLHAITGGQPASSLHWKEILQPAGLSDELRAALVVDGSCWGSLALARATSAASFTESDVSYLAGLSAPIALGVRASLVVGDPPLADTVFGPGLMILTEALQPEAVSPAAERWLAELKEAESEWMGPLPNSVYAVVTRLRQLDNTSDRLPDAMPRVRVRLPSGQWLSVQASWLHGVTGSDRIAVIIEAAAATQIAPLIAGAYGLTEREREITQHVLQGLSTKETAAILTISPATVQQHLTAIFGKVGVRSRRELVSRVFEQQYWPRIKTGAHIDANGAFTDS